MKRTLRRSWSFPRSQEWFSFWWGGGENFQKLKHTQPRITCIKDQVLITSMFRYQPPASKHTSHFSFSGRLGDSETYFNLGELPFYFTTIWIWENPKKDFCHPKMCCFLLDMLENPWHQQKKDTHFFGGLFWLDQLPVFFLNTKNGVQCQGPRNQIWILFHPEFP